MFPGVVLVGLKGRLAFEFRDGLERFGRLGQFRLGLDEKRRRTEGVVPDARQPFLCVVFAGVALAARGDRVPVAVSQPPAPLLGAVLVEFEPRLARVDRVELPL